MFRQFPICVRYLILSLLIPVASGNSIGANEEFHRILELLDSDRFEEAMMSADNLVDRYPNDPQIQFLKALILDRSGNSTDAMKAYELLIRDYPDFPEPYNNLAILQADMGDYNRAIETLESAFGTHDSYSTAYQNLQSI